MTAGFDQQVNVPSVPAFPPRWNCPPQAKRRLEGEHDYFSSTFVPQTYQVPLLARIPEELSYRERQVLIFGVAKVADLSVVVPVEVNYVRALRAPRRKKA